MGFPQVDVPTCIGLVVIGAIAFEALHVGGPAGITVAGTAIGGIAGWLARGAVTRLVAPDAALSTKDPAS